MNTIWLFYSGAARYECASFPFAFRMMHNAVRKANEAGSSITNKVSILSPTKQEYSWVQASRLATEQGLLTPDGQINGKEFKKKQV